MKSLAEEISRKTDVRVLSISHDVLLSRYVGEGESKLREIFSTASRYNDDVSHLDRCMGAHPHTHTYIYRHTNMFTHTHTCTHTLAYTQ